MQKLFQMRIILVMFLGIFLSVMAWGQKNSQAPLLISSQGISSPHTTSLVNYSFGFTSVNPAGAAFLGQPQISAEVDYATKSATNSGGTGLGAELGVGNQKMGIDLGLLKRDCTNCKAQWSLAAGYNTGSIAFGLGYRENKTYTLGFLLNTSGVHRFGLVGELFDSDTAGQDLQALGVGYSYIGTNLIFSLDASKVQTQTSQTTDKIIRWTPGVQLKSQPFSITVAYDSFSSDDTKLYESSLKIGLGYLASNYHLALYYKYMSDWAFVGTFYF